MAAAGYDVVCFSRPTVTFDGDCLPPYRVEWLMGLPTSGKAMYGKFMWAIWKHLWGGQFDLLWANDLDSLLPNVGIARLRNIPLVYDTHEYFTGMAELAHRPFERKVWRLLERMLFRYPHTVLTVNESVARQYEVEYARPLQVIYNFPRRADRRRYHPPRLVPPIRILYQGALHVGRGLELMIEALQYLSPEYHLDVVGKGPLEERMKVLARRRGVAERVTFHGHIPFSQLPVYTAQAHVGLSIESPAFANSAMSLPNKLLDYLNQGMPVVVSNLAEHARLVRRWGVGTIMKTYTADALVEAVREITSSETSYRRFARNAFEAVDTALSWEHQEPRLLKIIADALES